MARVRALLLSALIAALSLGLALPAGALLDTTGELVGSVEDAVVDSYQTATDGTEYDDPFFLNWPVFVPAVPTEEELVRVRDCPTGSTNCVDQVIREMTRRWERLGCDHDAVFALTYLLTTEEYRRAVEDPDFFEDNAHVNRQDVVFADVYFDAYDDWYRRDRPDRVPPAWRIAFHASEEREVSGMGSILLGMNAHIRRDLPFVLHAIGLTTPEGESRKPDHDRVNVILNAVAPTIFAETSERYDPTIAQGNIEGTTIDESTLMQMVVAWREEAWRHAELLAAASSEEERQQVARHIEESAAFSALAIRNLYAYDGVVTTSADRDSHCEAYHGDS